MEKHKTNMDIFIEAFHLYEERGVENMFSIVLCDDVPLPYPNNPKSEKLWDIGKKLWGREFIYRESEIRFARERALKQLRDKEV